MINCRRYLLAARRGQVCTDTRRVNQWSRTSHVCESQSMSSGLSVNVHSIRSSSRPLDHILKLCTCTSTLFPKLPALCYRLYQSASPPRRPFILLINFRLRLPLSGILYREVVLVTPHHERDRRWRRVADGGSVLSMHRQL